MGHTVRYLSHGTVWHVVYIRTRATESEIYHGVTPVSWYVTNGKTAIHPGRKNERTERTVDSSTYERSIALFAILLAGLARVTQRGIHCIVRYAMGVHARVTESQIPGYHTRI